MGEQEGVAGTGSLSLLFGVGASGSAQKPSRASRT